MHFCDVSRFVVGAGRDAHEFDRRMTTFGIAIGVIAILMTFHNLVGLTFSAHSPDAVFAGQVAHFPISITSQRHHQSIGVGLRNASLSFVDIVAAAEQRVEVAQLCKARGYQMLDPVRCQTIFPFGFLQAWAWLFFDVKCLVYPKPLKPETIEQSAGSSSGNESDTPVPGVEDFYGLRPYQPGDVMSRIYWKGMAKEKGLQTKEFVEYQSDPDIFSLSQFPSVDLEFGLSYLTYLVIEAHQDGRVFGLQLGEQTIAPQRGEEHMHQCLRMLALYKG